MAKKAASTTKRTGRAKTTKAKTSAAKAPAAKSTTTKKPQAKKAATKTAAPAKATKAGDKQMSAIDAAAQVLGESKEPLNTKQMIEAMAAKKLWTSPGGKTPWATLYSAILREINLKGKDSRFAKAERGKFTLA